MLSLPKYTSILGSGSPIKTNDFYYYRSYYNFGDIIIIRYEHSPEKIKAK